MPQLFGMGPRDYPSTISNLHILRSKQLINQSINEGPQAARPAFTIWSYYFTFISFSILLTRPSWRSSMTYYFVFNLMV